MGSFLLGAGIVLALHLLQGVLLFVLLATQKPGDGALSSGFYVVLGFGLTQLLYVVPAILLARSYGRPDLVPGMLTAAGVTLGLNGVLWWQLATGGNLVP